MVALPVAGSTAPSGLFEVQVPSSPLVKVAVFGVPASSVYPLLQTWYPHLPEVSLPLEPLSFASTVGLAVQWCQDYYLHSLYLLHLHYPQCPLLSQSPGSHLHFICQDGCFASRWVYRNIRVV